MAACPRCGEANPEPARYCWACGTALDGAIQPDLQTRRTVTVLFCDVSGSTRLGDHEDPERLRRVMSRYFDEARAVLERHGGTVEKFIGDAVMAVFGVPVLHEDDALRAVRAAVELREAMVPLNDELDRSFGLRLEIRTGVNTGEVVAGDPSRSDSFVTGDAVNVAQRLERAAAPGEILIGEATCWLVRDAVRVEALGTLALKGKDQPVPAYRLLDIVPGAPSHARRLNSPLVGRERERALLRSAFERAVDENTCHLFTVLGAAGVGKSRLVLEFATALEDRAEVLSASCPPYGEGVTFGPVLDVVRQATGITVDDSPHETRAKLVAALEDGGADESSASAAEAIAGLLGLDEGGPAGELGFWSVRKLLETVARKRSLLLVLDDLHWAEATLLDFTDHVADLARESPILLVCIARPELLDLRPAWGGGKHNATTISLEPLSEDDSERLIQNLLGAGALDASARARIRDSAEGNPLFVEEMLSMLIDDGLVWREAGQWTAAAGISRVPIPPSIHVLLAARLDRLDTAERHILERGAIEGKTFHRSAVEALTTMHHADDIARCVEQLVRKELIRPHSGSSSGGEAFRFRHVLIREVAYEALPKHVRSDLHERFAQWLEENPGSRLAELEEVLGYHLEQASRYRAEVARLDDHGHEIAVRAGEWLALAGRRALDRGDAKAAVNLFSRAAALLPDDHGRRISLLPELGAALRESGELVRAEKVLEEAVERAERASDRLAELGALIEQAALHLLRDPGAAETDALVHQVERAVPVLETLNEDRALAQAWSLIGSALGLWKGRFARGEQALERALVHARRAADRRQQAYILGRLGFSAQWGPTPVPLAIARCREIVEQADGDRLIEAGVLRYLACLEARLGRFDEGRSLAARAREGFEDLGMRLTAEAVRAFSSAEIEILAGDYAAAERELRAAANALAAMGERAYLSSVRAFLAIALYGQGRFAEATDLAASARQDTASYDIWTEVMSRGIQAKVLAQRGRCAEAEKLAQETLRPVSGTDALELHGTALLDIAEVLNLCNATERARPYAEEALRRFDEKGAPVLAGKARALL
jgi:class 3 adenylate cyclase/tetratricopeptide (TPR) repeat protein